MHVVNAICMQMQCYVWSLSIFASLLRCCKQCLIHLLINYFMSSTGHMASKKKSKTNEGGNKRNRKAIDLEKEKRKKKKALTQYII